MSTFLDKISRLFMSKEKKFILLLTEELEIKNYVNIRKIPSKLNIQGRYDLVNNYISEGKLQGVLLPERLLFLSIEKEKLSQIKDNLKTNGRLEISILKDLWKVKTDIIIGLLNHFERGINGKEAFYTLTYIHNTLFSSLSNAEEYNISTTSENLGIEQEILLPIVQQMIDEDELKGVIQDNNIYLGFEIFESLLSDYLDERIGEVSELSLNEISTSLSVLESDVEKYLMHLVEKNPGLFVIYPLEKRIQFKG